MSLFYTGNVKNLGDYNYVTNGRESNTILAVSKDGEKIESKKLLMTNAGYPDDMTCHVQGSEGVERGRPVLYGTGSQNKRR